MTPEQKAKQRAGLLEWAAKPAVKARLSASAKRRSQSEEAREENSLVMKAHFALPGAREKQSAVLKAAWADTAVKARALHMSAWSRAFKKANGYAPTPEEKADELARYLAGRST